ncbi:MAG: hypothetical protein A2Y57_00635 [Candidatus Woykebacteria bacterium RBG_13_40_7b]|uniref:DUF2292 domain-containing protein n=1 Tax=Candidatus Woykebacteria bacterium RBG_13_40_7b TaxID=1802594 RepID=A0A1G1W8G0_9BACT|nr:MAG: hypothetical protein A2Y57_00635 [Candidatus Woykebacteria bacterium RBG_13_40_7b]
MDALYKTTSISKELLDQIKDAISNKDYGSVEIYIEAGKVVQITERTIKKTVANNGNHKLRNWKPVYLSKGSRN